MDASLNRTFLPFDEPRGNTYEAASRKYNASEVPGDSQNKCDTHILAILFLKNGLQGFTLRRNLRKTEGKPGQTGKCELMKMVFHEKVTVSPSLVDRGGYHDIIWIGWRDAREKYDSRKSCLMKSDRFTVVGVGRQWKLP